MADGGKLAGVPEPAPGGALVVLGTGGTIAGSVHEGGGDRAGYKAAERSAASLLDAVDPPAGVRIEVEQVAQIDSKDLDFALWRRLAERCAAHLARPAVRGLVITHGTDTLEETAYLLSQIVDASTKPIVLTCAMRPANARSADGPQNLQDALAVAAHPGAAGVVAVCAGTIHGATDVAKVHPTRLDAFSSGEAGAIGQIVASRVFLRRNWPIAQEKWTSVAIKNIANEVAWPRVEIVMNHAGADGGIVRALVASGVRGLVAAGTGNGTLSAALTAALLDAQAAGVAVRRTTRCFDGRVVPPAPSGEPVEAIAVAAGLSPVKARIRLMLDLMEADAA